MCFALPHRIISLEESEAIMENGRRVKLNLLEAEDLKVGDHILVQANIAVEKIDTERARLIKQSLKN